MNELNEHIRNTWQQLNEATRKEQWQETQLAFRKMATLQDLDEQSRNIQQRIAGLSKEVSSNGDGPKEQQAVFHQPDRTRRATTRPQQVRIGSHRVPISLNNQIPVATANWILKQGKPLPRIPNVLLPNNSGFLASAQTRRLDDGSFIEIGDSQDTLIKRARRLLDACGFRDVEIEVQFEDGTSKTA